MASKSKQARQVQNKKADRLGIYIIAIPVLAFVIKMIVAVNIIPNVTFGGSLQYGGWLGADGENYLNGVSGLIADGLFSDASLLSYWPAGYPTLIWILAKISLVNVLWLLSILQSLFYAYASYYFSKQLLATKLNKYTFFIAVILAFNPTLSLSSLAVGYESPIAACMLMIIALILKSQQNEVDRKFWIRVTAVGGFFALAAFMQPRWLLTTAIVALIWSFVQKTRKAQALVLLVVMAIMSLSPLTLILRNIEAGKGSVISTNLGVTMRIGAGPETDGGYGRKGPEVPCEPEAPATTITDNDLVKCVIKWYLANPVKGAELAVRKSFHYWSPWTGPTGNGTMARNPWVKISPVQEIATGSEQGRSLVYGAFGKMISWAWLLGGISLFFTGFFWLRSMRGLYSLLAWLALSPVIASWVIGMGTIGDHRFRIPTMSLSLFLQVLGYYALKKKVTTGTFAETGQG
jgi:hypothetical protein